MPLQTVPSSAQYLHRRRVFVDPYIDRQNVAADGDISEITVKVDNHPQFVQSIELTNYNFPLDMAPTFINEDGDFAGSNYLDIRLQDYPAAVQTLEFTAVLPTYRFTSIQALKDYLPDFLDELMDAQSHAYFNTGNGDAFTVVDNQEFLNSGNTGAIIIKNERSSVANSNSLYYLFGTGANAANSPKNQLGFPDGGDVGGPQTINGTFITHPMPTTYWNLYPFRYVDLFIDEVSELTPHSRIWLTRTDDFKRVRQANDAVRLLADPKKRLETLTIRLRLPDGRRPNMISNQGYDLTFDILLVSPEVSIPDWVKQQIQY